MATETLSVKIVANANNFSSTLSRMEDEVEKVNKKLEGLNNLGEKFKDVGAKMTVAGAGIVASVGAIVAKGAEWQSNVESTQFLYNNLDKSVQQAITSNSNNAKAIGLTTQQYKSGATEISTYYKNMGLTATETSKLSGSTMDLVADLGAVADVPFDDALGDFKSALMGNYEAVDKYGISLSASTLESSEFVKGLGKSWNSLSDNEKMMASYNEIVRQGGSAQGLAAQEATSFSMQFKLLSQQIGETVGKIGSTLLPVLAPLVQKFSEVTDKVGKWVEENPKLTQAILLFVGILGTLLLVFGPILMIVGSCITTFVTLTGVAAGLGVGIGALVAPIGIAIAVIVGLIAFLVLLVTNFDGVKKAVLGLGDKIKEAWNNICNWVKTDTEAIGNIIKGGWDKITSWTSDTFSAIGNFVSQAWTTICNVVQTGVMLIGSIISAAFTIITLPFQFIWQNCNEIIIKYWNIIKNSVSTVITTISTLISSKFLIMKNNITNVWNIVSTETSRLWNGIKTIIQTIAGFIYTIVSTKFNAIKSTVTSITNLIKGVVSIGWNGIKSVVSTVATGITTVVSTKFNSIKTSISNSINSAKSIVSSGLSSISGFFSRCKLQLPKFKLPHFSVTGKLSINPPSVPSLKVNWYSKGGIFTKPSVLGGIGVGDKHNGIGSGAEAVLPLDKLPGLLGLDNNDNGGSITLNIENFNNNREQDIKQLLRELEFYRKRANKSVGGAY